MRSRSVRSVFCYAYRPGHMLDGGFAINLYSDDKLTFTTFNGQRQPLQELLFPLARGTSQRVLNSIRGADGWLRTFPMRMSCKPQPDTIAMVGLDGYPLFQLEDFQQLMTCEFRSIRGHYARQMFNLLEDISALLMAQGFVLSLDGFGWANDIQPEAPLPEQNSAGAIG